MLHASLCTCALAERACVQEAAEALQREPGPLVLHTAPTDLDPVTRAGAEVDAATGLSLRRVALLAADGDVLGEAAGLSNNAGLSLSLPLYGTE